MERAEPALEGGRVDHLEGGEGGEHQVHELHVAGRDGAQERGVAAEVGNGRVGAADEQKTDDV